MTQTVLPPPRSRTSPSSDGSPRPWVTGTLIPLLAGVLAVLLVAASAVATRDTSTVLAVALTAGLGLGALLSVLAMMRFEALVLVLLAVRPTLDAAKMTAGLEVPTVVAAGFLVSAAFWLTAQVLRERSRDLPLTRFGMVLLGVALVSTVLSVSPSTSAPEWARLGAVMLMFAVLERLARAPGGSRRQYAAAFLSLLVPLTVSAYQFFSGNIPETDSASGDGTFARVTGTLTHPNSLAMYLMFLIIPGVALVPRLRGWRRAGLVALLAAACGILLTTYGRGAWLGTAAGVLLVTWLTRRSYAVIALVVLALLAVSPPVQSRFADVTAAAEAEPAPGKLSTTSHDSATWRVQHWRDAVRLVQDRPVTGLGPGMVRSLSADGKSTHNDYLRSYLELGWLGVLAYAAFLANLVAVARRALRRARTPLDRSIAVGFAGALVGFLMVSVSDNVISQSVVLWYLAVSAAAASAVAAGFTHTRGAAPQDEVPASAAEPAGAAGR